MRQLVSAWRLDRPGGEPAALLDARPQPAQGAELGHRQEQVGIGGEPERQRVARRLGRHAPGVERAEVADAGGQNGGELLRLGGAGLVVHPPVGAQQAAPEAAVAQRRPRSRRCSTARPGHGCGASPVRAMKPIGSMPASRSSDGSGDAARVRHLQQRPHGLEPAEGRGLEAQRQEVELDAARAPRRGSAGSRPKPRAVAAPAKTSTSPSAPFSRSSSGGTPRGVEPGEDAARRPRARRAPGASAAG